MISCSIEGCEKIATKRTWCIMHYTRWRNHGDPLKTKYDRSVLGVTRLPEYKVWQNMLDRCRRPESSGYERYGGRGIKVCKEWQSSFLTFLKDMEEKPTPKHEIERIDNDGNYGPSNCKWATHKEQANNRRSNRLFTINGETRTLKQWSDFYNRNYKTVHMRINTYGWSINRALNI